MAQLNITLNQQEILQLLSCDPDKTFAKLLQESLNAILKAESTAQLQAEPYERTHNRTASRNGYREKPYTTRIGSIVLSVPKHRAGQSFHTLLFENYSRSEACLVACMAEMVVNGVSTRKVSKVMELLCGKTYSKSAVSEACKSLDEAVKKFRDRPLSGPYPFLTIDATYFKVREHARVISKAFMIGYATTQDGIREIVGFGIYDTENKANWNHFLKSLKDRGLYGVRLITSDAHDGIIDAITKQFPEAAWQRCQFHFIRNITDKTPKKYQKGLSSELHEMFECKTIEDAYKKKDEIIADYKDVAQSAMNILDEGFEATMSVMVFPVYLRKSFRTSNQIERLNKELKRRSKVIGIFTNKASLMRLMGSVLMERNEKLSAGRRLFSEETYRKIMGQETSIKLLHIAQEQKQLLAA